MSLRVALCAVALVSSRAAFKSELVVGGFIKPVFVTAPPGDTARLFVVEQTGRIRIVDLAARTIKSTPFITITNLLTSGEQGLLGLAFHPGYRTNGYFCVNQISRGGTAGHTEISRYQAQGDPATSDLADRSTRKLLLSFDQPEANHNGGWMAFGPDGFLYDSQGDGGGANDVHGSLGNGQNRAAFLGKILRIDVNGDPYSIPADNPFKGNDTFKEEIWAFGLRNPWRCSFDRQTGDLWIGDVGQDTREEIDILPAGLGGVNFGWRPREGFIQTPAYPSEKPVTTATDPVYDYTHAVGNSVTGGYVYRGSAIPELQGKYVFADYGSARFWTLTPDGTNRAAAQEITAQLNPAPKQIGSVSSFGEDASGELYICDYSGSQIFKVVGDGIRVSATRSGSDLILSFNTKPGQNYTVESNNSLAAANWSTVTNVPSASAGTTTVTNAITGAERYYRIRAN